MLSVFYLAIPLGRLVSIDINDKQYHCIFLSVYITRYYQSQPIHTHLFIFKYKIGKMTHLSYLQYILQQ